MLLNYWFFLLLCILFFCNFLRFISNTCFLCWDFYYRDHFYIFSISALWSTIWFNKNIIFFIIIFTNYYYFYFYYKLLLYYNIIFTWSIRIFFIIFWYRFITIYFFFLLLLFLLFSSDSSWLSNFDDCFCFFIILGFLNRNWFRSQLTFTRWTIISFGIIFFLFISFFCILGTLCFLRNLRRFF